MRLLCDEMLQRLAHWLRAAGYDTALAAPGATDRELMRRAVAEARLLITRDRDFLERREADRHVFFFDTVELDAQAQLLRDKLRIDWLHRPFSRCMVCNGVLEPAPETARRADLQGPLRRCPGCGRLYWEGSHVRRMRARLRGWATRCS